MAALSKLRTSLLDEYVPLHRTVRPFYEGARDEENRDDDCANIEIEGQRAVPAIHRKLDSVGAKFLRKLVEDESIAIVHHDPAPWWNRQARGQCIASLSYLPSGQRSFEMKHGLACF